MSQVETITNSSPFSRSNLNALDNRPQGLVNNVGNGITATLTWNLFNRSFPRFTEKLGKFSSFFWAPRKVVGGGVKNIQWGIKGTETYLEYAVGDLIQIKIKDRVKVYESIVPSSNQIKIQVSMDIPPHFHVDKFLDVGEYISFMNLYEEHLAESMAKTVYDLLRFFFLSSCFGTCLPSHEWDKLLLKTLALPPEQIPQLPNNYLTSGDSIYPPLTQYMLNHKDHFKMMSDEINKKVSNKWVFSVRDIVSNPSGYIFNPYNPWNPSGDYSEMDKMKVLANCLTTQPAVVQASRMDGAKLPDGTGPRPTRAQSLRAMAIIISNIAQRMNEPSYLWWQGNCGNISRKNNEDAWKDSNWPVNKERYPSGKGTVIMDKAMNERPLLYVECKKENRVLIMSTADFNDLNSGDYEGYYTQGELCKINWDQKAALFSEIITIPDMPCGHFQIFDKRAVCLVPHLDYTGTDTMAQRLVTNRTIHKWFIFGLFDQYCWARVQMVDFTGPAIDMNNIFIREKDLKMITAL